MIQTSCRAEPECARYAPRRDAAAAALTQTAPQTAVQRTAWLTAERGRRTGQTAQSLRTPTRLSLLTEHTVNSTLLLPLVQSMLAYGSSGSRRKCTAAFQTAVHKLLPAYAASPTLVRTHVCACQLGATSSAMQSEGRTGMLLLEEQVAQLGGGVHGVH